MRIDTTIGRISRRSFLAGTGAGLGAGLAGLAMPAWASKTVLDSFGLGAVSGYALADAATGEMLEAHAAERGIAPASVAKILTALYALETLGESYRFRTRLLATGPVEDGVLQGDLVLAGAGDPLLDTDTLGDMVAEARAAGLTGITGALVVAAGALPGLEMIEPGQPAHAAYNPAISGLNLNFNRVYLEWSPAEPSPKTGFRAPGARHSADVPGFALETGGARPDHRWQDGREIWTLPDRHLRGEGGTWLPVRDPAGYAGRALRALAAKQGLDLPEPRVVAAQPQGRTLASRDSARLAPMMRGMLEYSTNLTAEIAGLRAGASHGAAPADLAASADLMTAWSRDRYGLQRSAFVNHSGLTEHSVVAPAEMIRVLVAERDRLPELLRERPIRPAGDGTTPPRGVRVLAKTGTLYFVSALAGYLEAPRGRRLAFAILSADLDQRAAVPEHLRDEPPGGKAWLARARSQQHALLREWAARHAGGSLRPWPRPKPELVQAG